MSTPKQRRQRPTTGFRVQTDALMASEPWHAIKGLPGYVLHHTDGRLAREIKVRTNKDGTQWARVMRKGKQTVIRL